MSINRVHISGNLTRDIEVRSTAGGLSVGQFCVAVNDSRKNKDGEWETFPNYVDCTFFGRRVEALQSRMAKGTKVCVDGKLRYEAWEKDGIKRSKLVVIVEEIEVMAGKAEPVEAVVYDDDIPF